MKLRYPRKCRGVDENTETVTVIYRVLTTHTYIRVEANSIKQEGWRKIA